MIGWKSLLTAADAEDIRAFAIEESRQLAAFERGEKSSLGAAATPGANDMKSIPILTLICATLTAPTWAQTPPLPYGPPLTLEQARKVAAAAENEARTRHASVTVAIVDSGGTLVFEVRMDGAPLVSLRKPRRPKPHPLSSGSARPRAGSPPWVAAMSPPSPFPMSSQATVANCS